MAKNRSNRSQIRDWLSERWPRWGDLLKLRPVQNDCIAAIYESFRSGGTYHLVNCCISFGKTIVASELMRSAHATHGAKSLFMCHLTELVVQTVEKFGAVAPDVSCGVFMGSKKEQKDVTVGTRQTIGKNLDQFKAVNLIIIDEVHLYSAQYQAIVDHFLALNPRLRVLGVTGTPFSLRDGWIYGDDKRWPEPCFEAGITQMTEMGYLSPYRYKMASDVDLDGVGKTGGEFKEGELGDLMQEERHLGTIKHAIEEHAQDRKSIMVFCVTIDHAEAVAKFLDCEAVHSKLKKDVWRKRVDRFKNGEVRIIVNVSTLSVGFDAPIVDCLVVARPTMSTALNIQIIGRSLRILEGKKDALILDLVGNYLRHGLPNNPKIRAPKEKEDEKETKEKGASVCPECFDVVEAGVLICPDCGAEMLERKDIIELNEKLELEEVERIKNLPVVEVAGEKTGAVTSRGFKGSWFWVKLQDGKTLFKFCGDGTKKMEKERERVMALTAGDKVDVVATAYGDWIA